MNNGRILRLVFSPLILASLCWLPVSAHAISRIEIRIGEIHHPAADVADLKATVDAAGRWQGNALFKNVRLNALTQEFPLPVAISQGSADGRAEFSGEGSRPDRIKAALALRDVSFSDKAGTHAGEKIAGTIDIDVARAAERWAWNGRLVWQTGEVFWQPVYLGAERQMLEARGWLTSDALAVEKGEIDFPGIGRANFIGRMRLADKTLEALDIQATGWQMGKGYDQLARPFLDKTLLGNLEMSGQADFAMAMSQGRVRNFRLDLRDFDVEDKGGGFGLYQVDARIPWTADGVTQARWQFAGGHLLKMPLGRADLGATLNGYSLTAPVLRVPVLDGELALQNVSAAYVQDSWHWHLAASLSPVSMADFSHAVGWPAMQGRVAASIPMVTYSGGQMQVDGAMGFDVFNGSVVVRNLALQNPLGIAPRLQADISMRELDLDLLTRTFSFGAITGRLDGDVRNLELSRWQPVKFDADFRSAPGSYSKKISQRAVENISALGGAGAAAAIQRSFLKFFKEFNYAKIGLSCQLRNGVCAMGGAEKAAQGYVIVKGSGIPAVTVLGYNRSVNWTELLDRLRSVTQGQSSPVIK